MVFEEYSDICNYNKLQIVITVVTIMMYYAVQNIYYLENNIYIVVISMSIVQPVLTPEQITEITNYINSYRSKHQAPPLVWDSAIYKVAQDWSSYLVTNNLFKHSGNQSYGENLAYYQGYGTNVMTLLKKAVDGWYNEYKLYDFNNPGFSQATGHFTCLVWVASTNYGIGISLDNNTSSVDIVFNSSPPGNYIGQFKENVLPPVGQIVPTPTPTPTPTPSPTPTPTPTPTPIENNKKIIIVALYNIISSIQTNQPKVTIISAIYNLIKLINNMTGL